ncbi:MAG: cytochrome c [Rhodobiaceae bacterium]|nr:cytochrome c [Rhodobiaceae bacterium]MCC0060312.1 cytochrome c [Rhodobiaceae bacterium]
MSRFPESRLVTACVLAAGIVLTAGLAQAGKFGIGHEATSEEVAGWDIDVRPDGQGLPEGSGSVSQGEAIFSERCAVCHGDFAEGVDRWPVLAGGRDTLKSDRPVKTIGSYWPYLSTVFDYINRAMPFGDAQSLEPDEVYAITAFLLYMNDIVTDDQFVLSKENFTTIKMPNEANFIDDDRPDTPTLAKGEPCMSNCKESVEITGRARILDVTPDADEEGGGGID